MGVVILQLHTTGGIALIEPSLECNFLDAEIFCGPFSFVIEHRFYPVPLLMHLPHDRRGLLRKTRDVHIKSSVMLNNTLLQYVDATVAQRRDADVETQKPGGRRCDINELRSVVLAVHEFSKRHYPQVSVPSISLDFAVLLNRRNGDAWTKLCAFTHRARMRYYLYKARLVSEAW